MQTKKTRNNRWKNNFMKRKGNKKKQKYGGRGRGQIGGYKNQRIKGYWKEEEVKTPINAPRNTNQFIIDRHGEDLVDETRQIEEFSIDHFGTMEGLVNAQGKSHVSLRSSFPNSFSSSPFFIQNPNIELDLPKDDMAIDFPNDDPDFSSRYHRILQNEIKKLRSEKKILQEKYEETTKEMIKLKKELQNNQV
ncbi:hypothetical protein M0811_05945 [Anaeramoeba ignava]|uniref:Uncharacterized protein n=1 Tax=Anaeramoeba ignava TaxID=1746090 RepID=A0A9Q0LR27_ANAIG|nr:hypothetical protein M0811_05945 [Anaeramoeba ignava]|eukprot:Anaeramoba_ignava/a89716_100.p3 GENE.a89716_100~~a89716_100.p3  ORF type:complete len:192 (-),score=47.12 a89716_100:1225-1800(-)